MAAAAAGREDAKLPAGKNSSCLPSHHHHHHAAAWDDVVYRSKGGGKQLEQKNRVSGGGRNQQYKSSSACVNNMNNKQLHPPAHTQLLRPKSSQRPSSRQPNWVGSGGGGEGMRAIFLDSRQKPCTGTGVFLPRNAGASNTTNSSVCSPVLLPARVVQALNLNVHEIALLQVTRRHQLDAKSSSKPGRINNTAAARNNTTSTIELPQNENASPEIFLPKEWTY